MSEQIDFKQVVVLDSRIVVSWTKEDFSEYSWDNLPDWITVRDPSQNPVKMTINGVQLSVRKAWAVIPDEEGDLEVRQEKRRYYKLGREASKEFSDIRKRYRNSKFAGGISGRKVQAKHQFSFVSDEHR